MKPIDPIERAAVEAARQAHYAQTAAKLQTAAPATPTRAELVAALVEAFRAYLADASDEDVLAMALSRGLIDNTDDADPGIEATTAEPTAEATGETAADGADATEVKVAEDDEVQHPLNHDADGKPGGDAAAAKGLTKREIIADLIAMDVDHNPRADQSSLLALRNEARARRDAAQ